MRKLLAALVLMFGLSSGSAQAYDWACFAYFPCGPAGWTPPECGRVRKAMIDRVIRFKPLLPPPSSCLVRGQVSPEEMPAGFQLFNEPDATDNFDYVADKASLLYPAKWNPAKGGFWDDVPNLDLPPRIIEGGFCDDLTKEDKAPDYEGAPPWRCVGKMNSLRMFRNGEQYTNTFYMNKDRDPFQNLYDRGDYVYKIETGELVRLEDLLNDPAQTLE